MNLIPGKLYKIYEHQTTNWINTPTCVGIGMHIKIVKRIIESRWHGACARGIHQSYNIFLVDSGNISAFANNDNMLQRFTFEEVQTSS